MRAIESRANSYIATVFNPDGPLHSLIDEDPDVVVTVSVTSEGKTLLVGMARNVEGEDGSKSRTYDVRVPPEKRAKTTPPPAADEPPPAA